MAEVTGDARESGWTAVHDALAKLPGWAVGPCQMLGRMCPGTSRLSTRVGHIQGGWDANRGADTAEVTSRTPGRVWAIP